VLCLAAAGVSSSAAAPFSDVAPNSSSIDDAPSAIRVCSTFVCSQPTRDMGRYQVVGIMLAKLGTGHVERITRLFAGPCEKRRTQA